MKNFIDTTILIFNYEQYKKEKQENEAMGFDRPIEREFMLIPFTFDISEVIGFSPDYQGYDNKDLLKSEHYKDRTMIMFKNGDSANISISYKEFKTLYASYFENINKVSHKICVFDGINEKTSNRKGCNLKAK